MKFVFLLFAFLALLAICSASGSKSGSSGASRRRGGGSSRRRSGSGSKSGSKSSRRRSGSGSSRRRSKSSKSSKKSSRRRSGSGSSGRRRSSPSTRDPPSPVSRPSPPRPPPGCSVRPIANGRISASRINHGQYVYYTCNGGFTLDGQSPRQCSNGRLSGDAPSCIPNPIIYCRVPESNANGFSRPPRGASVSVGRSVEYFCESDYDLDGDDGATCLSNGRFSDPPPYCRERKRQCVVPRNPINGDVNPSPGGRVDEGESIYFDCFNGFSLRGADRATCLSNGRFDEDVPRCDEIDNDAPCGRPIRKKFGVSDERVIVSPDYTSYPSGKKVYFSCRTAFSLHGARYAVCYDGKWKFDYSNKGLPTCVSKFGNKYEH